MGDRRSAAGLVAGMLLTATAMLLLLTLPVVAACCWLAGFDEEGGDLGLALVAGAVATTNGLFFAGATQHLWASLTSRRAPRGLAAAWPLLLGCVAAALVLTA